MGDAVSEAARELSRRRWGSTRTHRLVDELVERVEQIEPAEAERLRAALAESRERRKVAAG